MDNLLLSNLLLFVGACLAVFGLHYLLIHRWLISLCRRRNVDPKYVSIGKNAIRSLLLFILILATLYIFSWDHSFGEWRGVNISISLFVKSITILITARFLDWLISNVFINEYYNKRDKALKSNKIDSHLVVTKPFGSKIVQYIVYTLAFILILRSFNLDFRLYEINYDGDQIIFRLSNIVFVVLIFLIARFLVWFVTQLFLYSIYKQKNVDVGAQYALNQLLKYVIYVITIFVALENLVVKMNIIWGGMAALLVGVGLGLQQTFNDFMSGIVLLFERTVKVGDVLELQDMVGTVKKIGLRASILETRANLNVVVPNSKLVNDNVINWTHFDDKNRFEIAVGVAYGSDTTVVKRLLLQSLENNPYIVKYPAPMVRFVDFGESSLNFVLYFFSRNFIVIEDVKSDIRFEIDRLFRENNIEIPFPQRDIWHRTKS